MDLVIEFACTQCVDHLAEPSLLVRIVAMRVGHVKAEKLIRKREHSMRSRVRVPIITKPASEMDPQIAMLPETSALT